MMNCLLLIVNLIKVRLMRRISRFPLWQSHHFVTFNSYRLSRLQNSQYTLNTYSNSSSLTPAMPVSSRITRNHRLPPSLRSIGQNLRNSQHQHALRPQNILQRQLLRY